MDSNTIQKFHAAINALDVAISACESLETAVSEEYESALALAEGGDESVQLSLHIDALPESYELSSDRDDLASLLIEGTPAAYIVLVEQCLEMDQRSLETFVVSRELPRTIGELVEGGVNFVFHAENAKSDGIVRCVDTSAERAKSHKLVVDGPAWHDKHGVVTIAAFSTPEKAESWCEEHYKGEKVTSRCSQLGDGCNLIHHWW
jgi:hypothetical protein